MSFTPTYSTPFLQNHADVIRADTRDMRRLVNPLAGIMSTHRNALGYRHSSPHGDSLLFGITGSPSDLPRLSVHCSLLTVRSSYTFSAKEKDSETGLSYFGSRYYSSDLSIWLSVDPMSDKYPSLSPYTYCADNPVRCVDPDGEEITEDKPPRGLFKLLSNLENNVYGTAENRQFEGGADGANQGTMTKQDVQVGITVLATMVTAGAAFEAEGTGSAIISTAAVVNNIDDATVNSTGQTFSQRKTENKPIANAAVNVAKTATPVASIGSSTVTIVKNGVKKASACMADVALSTYSFVKSLIHNKKSNVKP